MQTVWDNYYQVDSACSRKQEDTPYAPANGLKRES
jgi:hypothetical protein